VLSDTGRPPEPYTDAEFARAPNTQEAAIARTGASAVIRAIDDAELTSKGSGITLEA
jgi:hypothetical protein